MITEESALLILCDSFPHAPFSERESLLLPSPQPRNERGFRK